VRAALSLRVLMIAVLVAGVAWRVGRYAAHWPLWGDEAFVAVNLVDRDFAGMLRPPLEYGQIVPIGFLWAELAIAKVLGLSEWSMRLLPLLSGLAAFLLGWRLAVAVLDRRSALLAVAVLAASFYPVRHGVEVKPYAGDICVAVVMLWLAWRLKDRLGSIGLWIALTGVGVAAVWFSLPSIFVIGGVGLFLAWRGLVSRGLRYWVPLAIFAVITFASFACMYYVFAGPNTRANPWYWNIPTWQESFPPLKRPWLIPWWLLKVHAGNMLAYPVGGKNFGSAATLLLVVIGAVSLWRRGRRDGVVLLLAPLLPALGAAALRLYPYGTSTRVMLFMAPSFCLLAGAGLMAIFRRLRFGRTRAKAVRIVVVLLLIVAMVGLALDVLWPYKRRSNLVAKQTVQAIVANFSPGDRVLVGNGRENGQYLRRINGPDRSVFRFYLSTLSPVRLAWAVPPEQIKPVPADTWLVYFEKPKGADIADEEVRDEQFQAYLRQVIDRLGPPCVQEYELLRPYPDRPAARVKLYRFAPAGAASQKTVEAPW
jgi:4-amino-4-deoxy-L-arabinose transferase-like glycosyltransferase